MGASQEDPSGGFEHGGWVMPYTHDLIATVIRDEMNMPFDLLLGRKTFEIWAPYWSQHAHIWQGVNTATKMSRTGQSSVHRKPAEYRSLAIAIS